MSIYRKGFNLKDAKIHAGKIRSHYVRWRGSNLKPNDGATAICILLDRVEALEAENKKLKKAEKDRWLSDMENGI